MSRTRLIFEGDGGSFGIGISGTSAEDVRPFIDIGTPLYPRELGKLSQIAAVFGALGLGLRLEGRGGNGAEIDVLVSVCRRS